jgi:hypothetical protein
MPGVQHSRRLPEQKRTTDQKQKTQSTGRRSASESSRSVQLVKSVKSVEAPDRRATWLARSGWRRSLEPAKVNVVSVSSLNTVSWQRLSEAKTNRPTNDVRATRVVLFRRLRATVRVREGVSVYADCVLRFACKRNSSELHVSPLVSCDLCPIWSVWRFLCFGRGRQADSRLENCRMLCACMHENGLRKLGCWTCHDEPLQHQQLLRPAD